VRVTTLQRREWRRLRAEGWLYSEIAEHVGRHPDTVRHHCHDVKRQHEQREPVSCDDGRRWRMRAARPRDGRQAFAHALAEALCEGLPDEWRSRALRLL